MFEWISQKAKRVFRIVGGFLLILIGVLGSVIPVFQGWIFVLAGLTLLSTEFAWAHWLRCKMQKQIGRVRDWFRQTRAKP